MLLHTNCCESHTDFPAFSLLLCVLLACCISRGFRTIFLIRVTSAIEVTGGKTQSEVTTGLEELSAEAIKKLCSDDLVLQCTLGPDQALLIPGGWISIERTGILVALLVGCRP